MENMAQEISVFDTSEFEKMVEAKDIRISRALVETILKNLKGRKKYFHALSVLVVQEQTVYDITIDKDEFIHTLESNLPIYEKHELFEKCAEMVKALKYLKNKPKRGRPKKSLEK
tara:strand:- start:24 stop:368 length:345 start_codon:yes stop_codon:yes gene_type:complete